jgi:hypothetical protein
MNLSRKTESKPFEDEELQYKKFHIPAAERKLYQINVNATIPHGKYKNSTVGYVIDNDDWYTAFMHKEDLFFNWGLMQLKNEKPKSKNNGFLAESFGEYWLSIYVIEEKTNSSIYL